MLAGLNERRRELAILRSVGARPRDLFALLLIESVCVAGLGIACAFALVGLTVAVAAPWVQAQYGLALGALLPTAKEWQLAGGVLATAIGAGVVPAWRAYRLSLADAKSRKFLEGEMVKFLFEGGSKPPEGFVPPS